MQDSRYPQHPGSQNSNRQDYEKNLKVDAEERVDLYTIVREMREVEHGQTRVSRLFYAAQLNEFEKNKVDLEAAFTNWSSKYLEDETVKITGFMLIRGSFCFHLLESDSKVLNEYLKYLHAETKQKNSVYLGIYVLAFNEENPYRQYDEWGSYNSLTTGVVITKPEKSDQEMQDRIWAIYKMFCQAGARLKEKEKNVKKKSENRWKEASDEIALSNEDISIMVASRFMNLDDYYKLYLEDLEIELDSELQYPQHPTLLDTLEYKDNLI